MSQDSPRHSRERWGGLAGGLVLIAVGTAFLLAELHLLSLRHIWRWTPLILIAIGLGKIVTASRFDQVKSGLVLNLIGGWLLINFHGVWIFYFGNSWPLLLVGFGAIAIGEAIYKGTRRDADRDAGRTESGPGSTTGLPPLPPSFPTDPSSPHGGSDGR